ncbi:MAG: MOSC domain-containing protein [Proteobacteria bacterium]|nr:MAG: MOSC domain-containing protein [Pseudomonadota bacterium]
MIPKEIKNVKKVSVNLWDLNIDAAEESPLISQAISQYLPVPCKLVRYVDFSKRMAHSNDPTWQPEMRFPDGAPLLLVNQKSVDALNEKLAVPVPADRFRSNVLYNGSAAFEEDNWQRIRIGDVVFSNPKKCARCVMVTIDQQAGQKDGAEPLKTLAGFRRDGKSVNFGVLWIPENVGTIHSSDRIEVLT